MLLVIRSILEHASWDTDLPPELVEFVAGQMETEDHEKVQEIISICMKLESRLPDALE